MAVSPRNQPCQQLTLGTEAFTTLHSRLAQSFHKQNQDLSCAEQRNGQAEKRIRLLQAECHVLASKVDEKEAFYSAGILELQELRAQQEELKSRNASITASEERGAAQREAQREQYLSRERTRSARAFEMFEQVIHRDRINGQDAHDNVVNEILQLMGELEEGIDHLAMLPDDQAVLRTGTEECTFSCIHRIGVELLAKLDGKAESA